MKIIKAIFGIFTRNIVISISLSSFLSIESFTLFSLMY